MHKHQKESVCPHCGRPSAPPSRNPSYLAAAAGLLALAVFLSPAWRTSRSADGPREGIITEERAAFMLSSAGSAVCGPCLAAAEKHIREKRSGSMKVKTAGMRLVPAGQYSMGSPEGVGDPDERPRHTVDLDAFYIDEREVGVADYMKAAGEGGAPYPEWAKPGGDFNIRTGSNPHYRRLAGLFAECSSCPVVGVTAREAAAYCALSGRRLPTEAEWEVAARGGTQTVFHFGDSAAAIGDYAWYEGNAGGAPHPAAQKKPNVYGLYDMHGNVWEWTADLYGKKYYAESPSFSPRGPENGFENVLRGGSWAFESEALRAGNRASSAKANDDIGFRCAIGKHEVELLVESEHR